MKKFFGVLFVSALLVLGAHSRADAAPIVTLHICQTGFACQDFTAGTDFASTGGTITEGDYSVSASAQGVNDTPSISLTGVLRVVRTGSTNGNSLDVWVQATGYTLPTGPAFLVDTTLGASKTGSATNSESYMAWLSPTNASGYPPAGSTTTPLISCTPPAGGTTSCSADAPANPAPSGNPYSVVTRNSFNIAIGDGSSFGSTAQTSVTAVPEPASLTLLGTGLFGVAGAIRRRRRA